MTIARFKKIIYAHYHASGRHTLPWRQTRDPYHILVSELMLQQTQVDRVIPKYQAFIATYPNVATLARAALGDVLKIWVGLGYNRRAKYLHEAAKVIAVEGWPGTESELRALPGVGVYTAGAVATFAFNQPVAIIETNIRAVFIEHFFADKAQVHDEEILPLVAKALDYDNPREWYYALMDYGSSLKRQKGSLTTKSVHYKKQKPFKGSVRQLRGAVVRTLVSAGKAKSIEYLVAETQAEEKLLVSVLEQLTGDGLVQKQKNLYLVAT